MPGAADQAETLGHRQARVRTDLAPAALGEVLLAHSIGVVELARIGDEVDGAAVMLDLGRERGRCLSLAAASRRLGAKLRVLADPHAQIDRAEVGAPLVALVGYRGGADAKPLVGAGPGRARAGVPFPSGKLVDFVIDHHEARIEFGVAA